MLHKGRIIPRRRVDQPNFDIGLALQILFKKNNDFYQCVKEWENSFANFIGVNNAVAVSSGRKGMELILRSLELDEGSEVIIPAYTLKSLIDIIKSLGLAPVPADIDVDTFNLDPDSVASRVTKRTKVILATHLFGLPCQIDKILEIGRERSIFVIEDCAHSAGSEFKGKKAGSFGDVSFFSFETIIYWLVVFVYKQ